MDKLRDFVWDIARNQSLRLRKDNAGHSPQAIVFSLSGVCMTALASLMLLNSSFNMQSQYFVGKLLKALSIF